MPRALMTIALLLALLLPSASARADHDQEREATLHELLDALVAARDELRSLDGLVGDAASANVQREIRRKVRRVNELLDRSDALSRELGRRRDAPPIVIQIERPAEPVVIVDEGPFACAPGDFDAIVRAVEAESFSDGKLSVISGAGLHRWFNVQQVIRLMGLMTFGKDKVEVGALLFSRTINQQDWYQVYGQLTFDSEKAALRQRVGQ